MKKGGCRLRMKRVSSAVKEQRCGVPCTLLLATWSVFLLLLLTSSISERDGRDAEDGLAREAQDGPDSSGDLGGLDRRLLPISAEVDGGVELDSDGNGEELSAKRRPFQEGGPAINALQYAEYGADLLQKSGPVAGSSRICLIGNPAGTTHYRVISNRGQKCAAGPEVGLPPHEHLPCLDNDAPDFCQDAVRYGGDVIAELAPGGASYLVCQSDSSSSSVVCDVACMTQSECFLSEADSNGLCRYDGSIRDFWRHSCGEFAGLGQHEAAALADSGLSGEAATTSSHSSGENTMAATAEESENDEREAEKLQGMKTREDSRELGDKERIDEKESLHIASQVQESEERVRESADSVAPLGSDDSREGSSSVTIEVSAGQDLVHGLLGTRNGTQEGGDVSVPLPTVELEEGEPRRLKRVGSVMSLDEYKRSILEKQELSGGQADLASAQAQKIRHSDQSYNYAGASQGAKVLTSNKEAKGAGHVLSSDKDKYLRNPCGVDDKHVVVELSEETFVDTIVISNFEFHSSNVKDFEVLGSPLYPAKEWISLGKFQAENVRHKQKFNIDDPKLVRYLMLKLLTHWGSEFFCTLSVFEVFGVDVIKNLLDDYFALDEADSSARTHGSNGPAASHDDGGSTANVQQSVQHPSEDTAGAALDALFLETLNNQPAAADSHPGPDQDGKAKAADGPQGEEDSKPGGAGGGAVGGGVLTGDFSAQENFHIAGGKPAGDSVLKILMQRVKALESNQTLFDSYLGDMNQKYKAMLSELDRDLALVTERLRNETLLTASLAMRLAHRELERKEERLHIEHRFAQIASNFTDNLGFMRWQVQSMERREIAAIALCFFAMLFSALLHFLARCKPRKTVTTTTIDISKEKQKEMESKLDRWCLSTVCQNTSTFVLYLASGLTILVLSV